MSLSADDLRFNPPKLDGEILRRAAAEIFGVHGAMRPLEGERDQNTLVTTDAGERYVLKVSGALEDRLITDFQTRALLHLERIAPEIPVPRVVRNLDGQPAGELPGVGEERHVVRLLSYISGITFDDTSAIAADDLQAMGGFLGGVNLALASFRHPVARHFMPWDVSNGLLDNTELWSNAEDDTLEIAAPLRRDLAERVLPAISELRAQVIHNDAHMGNLLRPKATSHQVIGLIDFGDMVEAPLVLDLAVMAASFCCVNDDCLPTVASLARGFDRVVPLTNSEIEQLYDLILARLVLSALLFDFQIAHGAGALNVTLADRPAGLHCLREWLQVDASELCDCVRSALDAGKPNID